MSFEAFSSSQGYRAKGVPNAGEGVNAGFCEIGEYISV